MKKFKNCCNTCIVLSDYLQIFRQKRNTHHNSAVAYVKMVCFALVVKIKNELMLK